MKICIFGSRDVNVYQCREAVFNFVASTNIESTIIEGEARGVDNEACRASEFYRRKIEKYPPNYYKHGRKATLRRNDIMVEVSDSGFGVWNGSSTGTNYTYLQFMKTDKDIKIVKIDKK